MPLAMMKLGFALSLVSLANSACLSTGNQDSINQLLQQGGANTIVSLCPGSTISITDSIVFTAPGQEISTQGYPTDTARATIIILPGSSVSAAIRGNWQDGVKVLNVQIDGNRPNAGLYTGPGADALLEMGGGTTDQTVSHVVAKNTRSWSCMHFIGSGQEDNPCRNANITFNTVGPCGDEGHDADGNALWADGMSIECVTSTVTDNTITAPTDGGIVIFGAPGSHFLRNTITSPSTALGFGAINMVDPTYGGNYSNVVVADNTIVGVAPGFFNLGIGIGSQIWSNPHYEPTNFGPTTVSNNVFRGAIGFSVVVNGWEGGLTAQGNDVGGVHAPSSDTADASGCGAQQQASFAASEQLIVYAPGVRGPSSIQEEFVRIPNNGSNWLCLTHPLPSQRSFAPQSLFVTAQQSTVVDLGGFHVQFQGDGNLVGLDTTGAAWTPRWATSTSSAAYGEEGEDCLLAWGADGNFVLYDANGPFYDSGTSGRGAELTFYNRAPWVAITDAAGKQIWKVDG